MRATDDLKILANCPPPESQRGEGAAGWRPKQISVQWQAEVPAVPTHAVERLESRWKDYHEEARARGATLFNGAITQLLEARAELSDSAPPRVMLRLAPADYRTFLATRVRDRAWFEENAPEAMARALGNSVLLTRGGEAVLGIRSETVSLYPRRAHLIGGVLERLGSDAFPAHVGGLIAHLLKELREEAGVGEAELAPLGDWPRLIGLAEDAFLGQPEAVWRWETRVDPTEIARRLERIGGEHAGAVIVRRGDRNAGMRERMTPMARMAVDTWEHF